MKSQSQAYCFQTAIYGDIREANGMNIGVWPVLEERNLANKMQGGDSKEDK
jgi:hypothetical protein